MGAPSHGGFCFRLGRYLGNRARQWKVLVSLEQRIRVAPRRVRIPDVGVFLRDRELEEVPTTPPLVCIEVLSPEDRWLGVEKRIADFLAMGVQWIWIFDPKRRRVFEYTKSGKREVLEDLLEAPPVSIRISELMAELD